jgi:hypothetical protein
LPYSIYTFGVVDFDAHVTVFKLFKLIWRLMMLT